MCDSIRDTHTLLLAGTIESGSPGTEHTLIIRHRVFYSPKVARGCTAGWAQVGLVRVVPAIRSCFDRLFFPVFGS